VRWLRPAPSKGNSRLSLISSISRISSSADASSEVDVHKQQGWQAYSTWTRAVAAAAGGLMLACVFAAAVLDAAGVP
jgi:hypothetical protein